MGTALMKPNELLQKRKVEIKKLLPRHINIDRFVKSAVLVIHGNSALQNCSQESILKSVYQAAELGLDFTPIKRQAAMIPYKGEATFMPMVGGFIDLARRSEDVMKIESHNVYEKDEFEIHYGTESQIIHTPYLGAEPGEIIGCYAIGFLKDADPVFEFMTVSELNKVKEFALKNKKNRADSPWMTWTSEQYRKTVIKRLCKYLPISPDLEKAMEYDNETSGFDFNESDSDMPDLDSGGGLDQSKEIEQPKEPEKKKTKPKKSKPPAPEKSDKPAQNKQYKPSIAITQDELDDMSKKELHQFVDEHNLSLHKKIDSGTKATELRKLISEAVILTDPPKDESVAGEDDEVPELDGSDTGESDTGENEDDNPIGSPDGEEAESDSGKETGADTIAPKSIKDLF